MTAQPHLWQKVTAPISLGFRCASGQGVPHISLVFCEMWETRTLIWVVEEFGMAKAVRWSAVESHISQKTSEIWGTQRFA